MVSGCERRGAGGDDHFACGGYAPGGLSFGPGAVDPLEDSDAAPTGEQWAESAGSAGVSDCAADGFGAVEVSCRRRPGSTDPGQIDIGGLTPGVYQIRMAGPNQDGRAAALVEVSANSARTLDMTAPARDLARITVRLDGLADVDSESRGDRVVCR